MSEIGTDIELAASLLRRGELVGIPTETVYGLAGNALNPAAVAQIFSVKQRPTFDPLIVHVSNIGQLKQWVAELPKQAAWVAEQLMPGPLTLLLPKKASIPDLVTAGSPLVAVRIPAHPLTLELLSKLDFPLAAPSANPFGYISPTTAAHVNRQLGSLIPYILDGGSCQIGLESTILGWEEGIPTVYRKGGIAVEVLEDLLGPLVVKPHSSSQPQAPGMLQSHYAPRAPLVIGDLRSLLAAYRGKRIGLLAFRRGMPEIDPAQQVILSATGDYKEAAQHLFAGMRYLDEQNLDIILAELLPEENLGRAINDRLRRAAAPGAHAPDQ
ncbi:MAG: threonylcarbamoyl-AMP synthase [Lewinellaceae bacterium]|nr:threonylcarbamoyl-AMP synthase [Lewinellaceae bacterium]